MSAPMLRKNITFSKLRYVHDFFRRSKNKWTGKRTKEKQITGEGSSQDSLMSFRAMTEKYYLQADRSILIQLQNQDDMDDMLTRVQQQYGTFEKGFCYSDINGKKLVMIELTNQMKLKRQASTHVRNLNNLQSVNNCDKTLMNKIEEYKPKTLQLDMLNHCESVSDQVLCLHKEMQMSEAMVRLHFFVGMLVTRTIKRRFKDAQTMIFGSSSCGLAVEGKSDLDVVVLMDGITQPNDVLEPLSKEFRSSTYFFKNAYHIQQARVPIIKFHQSHTNMSCDLCCNTLSGVLMAEMLHWLNLYEPMFYPLVMTVKIWGKNHHVTSQGMGYHFSNHMLTMLVLAYLQQVELLPALKPLYAKTDRVAKQYGTLSAWKDTELKKVKRNVHKIFIQKDIGSLLLEFFQYYSRFPFHNHIIDVYFGKVIKRPHKYDICVLNPHEKGHNVCQNVRAIQLDRFQTLCKHSAKLLELYQQKTADGTPWGLACVLSNDTLKEKKRGKLYDLDIDFSAEDGHVQQVAIEVGGDEEIYVDELHISDYTLNDTRVAEFSSFVIENQNPQKSKLNSSSVRIDDARQEHSENMKESSIQYNETENIEKGTNNDSQSTHRQMMKLKSSQQKDTFKIFFDNMKVGKSGSGTGKDSDTYFELRKRHVKEILSENDIERSDMERNSGVGCTSEKKKRERLNKKKKKKIVQESA